MSNEFRGLRYSSIAIPFIPVGHPRYVWRGHADTDVQRTWRYYGWKPNSERATQSANTLAQPPAQVVRPVWKTR